MVKRKAEDSPNPSDLAVLQCLHQLRQVVAQSDQQSIDDVQRQVQALTNSCKKESDKSNETISNRREEAQSDIQRETEDVLSLLQEVDDNFKKHRDECIRKIKLASKEIQKDIQKMMTELSELMASSGGDAKLGADQEKKIENAVKSIKGDIDALKKTLNANFSAKKVRVA
eukprot:GCRY01007270.1.p1 GENE.GCRY01007270.1~~GCRY01007270.1.p1  ORF type:complete len:171 (-),score=26.98 GCRY01007270.1:41-553(-)